MNWVFHAIDAVVLASLLALGFMRPDFEGGPFFGVVIYPLARYALAYYAESSLRRAYFCWLIFAFVDFVAAGGLAAAGLLFPVFEGAPLIGAVIFALALLGKTYLIGDGYDPSHNR